MALTDTAVRGAKPGNRPYKIYDRDGLFLLINPSGSKLWRWRYRFDGKEKLMALNEYPVVNLAQARERQFAARKKLADGSIPWRSGRLRPRSVTGKPKYNSVRPKTALRVSLEDGGHGGRLASPSDMPKQ